MAIFGNDKSASAGAITSSGNEPLRYRLYYRLMDISSVVYVLAVTMAITVMMTKVDPETFPTIIGIGVPIIVFLVTFLVLPVLIVSSRMRDEYADLLWTRTVKQLTILTVLFPPLMSVLLRILHFVILEGDPIAERLASEEPVTQ